MNFWILCFPDIDKPIGGVKQMHRLAEALDAIGHRSFLVQDQDFFQPKWFCSQVNKVSKQEFFSRVRDPRKDIVVIPETFLPILSELDVNSTVIVFNQNSSYTFGLSDAKYLKPASVIDCYLNHPAIKAVWCVSQYDRDFLVHGIGVPSSKVFVLQNCLEDSCFDPVPLNPIKKQIVFMPRKNTRDSSIVTSMISSKPFISDWILQPLHNLPHQQVLQSFRESLIYLSFGFPEGFGLPVAEAMACGCAVIGYSGLGGAELFVLPNSLGISSEVQYGDWVGFVSGLQQIIHLYDTNPDYFLSCLHFNSQHIQRNYSVDSFNNSVRRSLLSQFA